MKRRLFAALGGLALVLALFPSVASATITCPSASLAQTDIPDGSTGSGVLVLYESSGYNAGYTSTSAHAGTLCFRVFPTTGLSVPNLVNVPYSDSGASDICDGQLAGQYGTWNDCASSFKVNTDCHHTIFLYSGANYVGNIYTIDGGARNVSDLTPINNDTISSVKITYHSSCTASLAQ